MQDIVDQHFTSVSNIISNRLTHGVLGFLWYLVYDKQLI